MTNIDVCIVAYDNADTIGASIESLATIGDGVQVSVCDNHPDQGTLAHAVAAADRVGVPIRTLARPDNPGFAVACNQLATGSQAEWLLFLNPDASVTTWPRPTTLHNGVTGPLIVGPDGRREYTFGRRRNIRNEISRRLQIRPCRSAPVGYVSGAAMIMERREFLRLGGFDERYFMYYEDIDLCRTVLQRGGRVRLDPAFVVTHVGGHSSAPSPTATSLRSYESARQYYAKWTGTTRWIDLVVLVDSALRAAVGAVRLPIPGSVGAGATMRCAWSNLRTGREPLPLVK